MNEYGKSIVIRAKDYKALSVSAALGFGYARPSGIKRRRRHLLRKARALDKGSYEQTQYHWPYGKARRNATRYSNRKGW